MRSSECTAPSDGVAEHVDAWSGTNVILNCRPTQSSRCNGWLSFILQYLLRSRIPNDAVFGLRFHQASPLLRLLTTLFRLPSSLLRSLNSH